MRLLGPTRHRSGFAIWAKRLEAGVFAIPSGEPGAARFEITVEELGALLSGIDLERATRRKRYRRAERQAVLSDGKSESSSPGSPA